MLDATFTIDTYRFVIRGFIVRLDVALQAVRSGEASFTIFIGTYIWSFARMRPLVRFQVVRGRKGLTTTLLSAP